MTINGAVKGRPMCTRLRLEKICNAICMPDYKTVPFKIYGKKTFLLFTREKNENTIDLIIFYQK